MDAMFLWLILMMIFLALGYFLGARRRASCHADEPEADGIGPDVLAELEQTVATVLSVTGRRTSGPVAQFEGRLRTDAEQAVARLKEAFQSHQLQPVLQEADSNEVRVTLLPLAGQAAGEGKPRWGVHGLLFVLTLATTTWAGALHAGVNLLEEPGRFMVGLPYSLALMLILSAHELGHYFTARRHGVRVTPPYFIPVPFALGTFGAFIKIKSLSPNRRAGFDVAVAGPLAGLVFAIPALILGIGQSTLVVGNAATGTGHTGVQIGSSFMMALLAKVALGAETLQGHQLLLHPLAFAGWLGLLVTALNLLPIGQLDGGHMAHALFGARHGHTISVVGLVILFALALFVWPGLMMWAFVVWFIAGTRDAPPLNDITPVSTGRKALGCCAFLLLGLILIPVPHALYPTIGIHCPYL